MAPHNRRNGNNNGGAGSKFTPPKLFCKKQGGCTGSCPAHVVATRDALGKKTLCKECGLPYKLPPGAERLAKRKADDEGQSRKEKSLQAQVANLTKRLEAASSPSSEAEASEGTKPTVKQLQEHLESCKTMGFCTIEAEAKLERAKEEGEKEPSLQQVLKKLKTAQNRATQLAEQVILNEQKLATSKENALEAAKAVQKLEEQKSDLWVKEGHATLKTAVPLPPLPSGVPQDLQTQWKEKMAELQAAFAKQMEEFTKSLIPPSVDEKDLDGGEPPAKAPRNEPPAKEDPPQQKDGMEVDDKQEGGQQQEASPGTPAPGASSGSDPPPAEGSFQGTEGLTPEQLAAKLENEARERAGTDKGKENDKSARTEKARVSPY